MALTFFFIKAWMIGMAIAAPVGPIGMMCIRKTLELGIRGTVAVGVGAALADSIYGLIAALGLTAVSHFLLEQAVFIKIIGGFFLLYLAYTEIRNSVITPGLHLGRDTNMLKLASAVFFLTLANPMTILSFIGIFASIGGGAVTVLESFAMVTGIFLGSMMWWLILGTVIINIKHRLPETWMSRIRYISAFILGSFGVWAILSLL